MVDMYSRVSSQRAQRGLALPVPPQVGDCLSSFLGHILQLVVSLGFHLFLHFLFFVQMSPHVFAALSKVPLTDVDAIINVF